MMKRRDFLKASVALLPLGGLVGASKAGPVSKRARVQELMSYGFYTMTDAQHVELMQLLSADEMCDAPECQDIYDDLYSKVSKRILEANSLMES